MANNTFTQLFRKKYTDIKYIDHIVITNTKVTSLEESVCEEGSFSKCRLMFVVKGGLFIKSGESYILASEGDIVYIPSEIGYTFSRTSNEKCEYYSLTFVFCDKENNSFKISDEISLISNDSYGDIFQYVKEINVLYGKKNEEDVFFFKGAVYKLFGEILKKLSEKEKTARKLDDNSIAKAKIFIDENYIHNITIEKLAQMCNVSQSTFNRKFIKNYGITPHKYITSIKMKEADRQLKNDSATIAEIAERLGFTDASHFNKIYKQYYNIAPRNRKKNKITGK